MILDSIKFIKSPNYNHRPEGILIDMIIIHSISLPEGEFGGNEVINLFMNQSLLITDLKVSSHLFIRRTGEIIQFVPFHLRAWHAGVSCFEGREECNDFSIGIELEGTDNMPYENIQYEQLNKIIFLLKKNYPAITDHRIVGHSDVAPGRKSDPGKFFDWKKIKNIPISLVQAIILLFWRQYMTSLLSILIVWIILRYFKNTLILKLKDFEKYYYWLNYKLEKITQNQSVKNFLIIFLPLFAFGVLFYDLKIRHFYLLAFFINTVILWYGCIYRKKIEVIPASFEAQEEDIFVRPLSHGFTVVFWFLVLGPVGVLLYDFVRRLEFFPVNQLLEWPAARILGLGYALAGHFSPVFTYWSHYLFTEPQQNEYYIKNCGRLALHGNAEIHSVDERALNLARALVRRAKMMLFIVVLIFSIGAMFVNECY